MCEQQYVDPQDYLDIIYQNLYEAEISFRLYCHILKMRSNRRRLEVFEKSPVFLNHIQNISIYDCIMKMTKIMDPKTQGRSGNRENIVFGLLEEVFSDFANEQELAEIKKLTNYLSSELKGIKNIRDKEIAHLDKESRRSQVFRDANKKRKDVRKYLDIQMKLLNIYKRIHCRNAFIPYHFEYFINKDIRYVFSSLYKMAKDLDSKTEMQKELDEKVSRMVAKHNIKKIAKIENEILNKR
ncbi:Uncharacterised protein [Canicola haemoglobinophilus]|uniref:HEPN AbiU2-like domain-containing protein n=1 Tax=Canicola haemoglobinophilus TaxID=733 RepID=A0AB38H989_9PAST|nr:hypothetical protein [Canicola haemoglobinophilus]STO55484.1 Uncharacterised protein [Canicola haemoglobinophilus]STO67811.1 Uncharacterised protein [Canicola haemoglobinophilus]